MSKSEPSVKKQVVYQVFTRLFGNTNTTNKPWGTHEENGVGKFDDFSIHALNEIKDLGVTHIWYTGILHHALINDYSDYGISHDDPDIVKGRAGSPYAVKDYYNVNPDLANDPSRRLEEFESLIKRTHQVGLKVLIDIIPNHIARKYEGLTNPEGVEDFGATDNTAVAYEANNNFYYNPGEAFKVPRWENGYLPLGGEAHPLSDGHFEEFPAKWTGNGSRASQPGPHDWYETVKINYGERPDGTRDFPSLPAGFEDQSHDIHYDFWRDKSLPDSWYKFRDIALYWLEKGVDGFRFDMAEMVPVEFWSFMNSSIKKKNPEAFILAEVYNPDLYRDYIKRGKMDYLYDKVQLYDTLKHIMQGHGRTENIPPIQSYLADIEHHMLHFLENHDEQRIASPEFAGDAHKGLPAMVVSTLISSSPTMIYFGQEVGEPGAENAGFGQPSRTSMFDYIGVPHFQRWTNNHLYDGGQLSDEEQSLRDFYKRLLNFSIQSDALTGNYRDLHIYNLGSTPGYNNRIYSFARWKGDDRLVIVSNFDVEHTYNFEMGIPEDINTEWGLKDGLYNLSDQLSPGVKGQLTIVNGKGLLPIKLNPLESRVFQVN